MASICVAVVMCEGKENKHRSCLGFPWSFSPNGGMENALLALSSLMISPHLAAFI